MKIIKKISERFEKEGTSVVSFRIGAEDKENSFQKRLDELADRIAPSDRTYEQMIDYMKSKYDVHEMELNSTDKNVMKVNVINNFYPHMLKNPPFTVNKDGAKELNYKNMKASYVEANTSSADELHFDIRGYKISSDNEEGILHIEMASGYYNSNSISSEVIKDLLLWKGVTQKDIDERNAHFIDYVHYAGLLKS